MGNLVQYQDATVLDITEATMMEMVVTAGAVRCTKFSQIVTNSIPKLNFLQAGCPFLSPNQQCYSTDLLIPSSPGGLPALF